MRHVNWSEAQTAMRNNIGKTIRTLAYLALFSHVTAHAACSRRASTWRPWRVQASSFTTWVLLWGGSHRNASRRQHNFLDYWPCPVHVGNNKLDF